MRQTTTVLLVLTIALAPGSAQSDVDLAEAVVATVAAATLLGLVCGATAINIGVQPGDDEEYARRGWQIGVAARYAIETFTDDEPLSTDNSLGISGQLGYRCHRRFSVEVEVEWLDGFEADGSVAGLGKVEAELEPVVVTTNVKGYILTGRVQPFLLVGAGLMTADIHLNLRDLGLSDSESETDFAMRFGGGIDLYATKHVVVSAEAQYVRPFEGLQDFDYVSIGLGLAYRF